MKIREARVEDTERIRHIRAESYFTGMEDFFNFNLETRVSQNAIIFVAEDERGVQGAAGINRAVSYFQNQEFMMGGIGGVAVAPQARRSGYAEALMLHCLEVMKEEKIPLSTLYPFSFRYYRKFGWEWVGSKLEQTVDFKLLTPLQDITGMREGGKNEILLLDEMYEQYARQFRGCLKRAPHWWVRKLKDKSDNRLAVYIYENNSRPEGYFLYHITHDEVMDVAEWVALTPKAYKSMLAFAGVHSMRHKKLSFNAPSDDPLRLNLFDWDVDVELSAVYQARVVDVPLAISMLKPLDEGYFTLKISDSTASWNNSSWKIDYSEGNVEVSPHLGESQVAMDIQSFSQIFYGDPHAETVRSAGKIEVRSEQEWKSFTNLFPPAVVWTLDHF